MAAESSRPTLPRRTFGRLGLAVPPVLWHVTAPTDPSLVSAAVSLGADAFWIDADATHVPSAPPATWFVGVSLEEATRADPTRLLAILDQLPGRRAVGVVLQHAAAAQLKAGRAIDRLQRLRQAGRFDALVLEAATTADAEWMTDNTPAHAIVAAYDLADQSAGWRVLASAAELGVAILATRSPETEAAHAWLAPHAPTPASLDGFRLADPRVTMAAEAFPASLDRLDAIAAAALTPMSDSERDEWTARYRAVHAEPKRSRTGHPPDE